MPEAKRHVAESAVAVVVVEIAGIVGEIGFENVEPAIAVVVTDGDAHSGLLVAIFAVSASGHDGDVGESAVVVVAEQDAGLGIDRDVNVRPAVVIEIVGDGRDGVARAGFEDAGFLGDVGKCAVAIVAVRERSCRRSGRAGRT